MQIHHLELLHPKIDIFTTTEATQSVAEFHENKSMTQFNFHKGNDLTDPSSTPHAAINFLLFPTLNQGKLELSGEKKQNKAK